MNRSLEQGKAVLSQTNREGTSIEMELRNMDDNQVRLDVEKYPEIAMHIQLKKSVSHSVKLCIGVVRFRTFGSLLFVLLLFCFILFMSFSLFDLEFKFLHRHKAIEAQKGILKH